MKKDSLSKFYHHLTPEERFRLLVEALARADAGECRNLNKSCPRLNYEMNDRAYVERVRASEEVTVLACLDLAPRLAKVRMLTAFSNVLIALRNTALEEAYSAYLRGRAAGGGIRRSGNPKGHPPEPRNPDHGTGDVLSDITVRMEEGWAVFAEPIGQLEETMRMEVAAIWEAFSEFARTEIGVEPKTLIKVWFGPVLPEIEAIEEALDSTAMDPEKLEEYGSVLRRLWSALVP